VNGATIAGFIRTAAVVAVLVAAAVLGLVVGSALNDRDATNLGYPAGWAGGAAVPGPALDAAALSDFGIRHAVNQAAQLSDYGTRHAGPAAELSDYGTRHGTPADGGNQETIELRKRGITIP
jgi:hypothetical protein